MIFEPPAGFNGLSVVLPCFNIGRVIRENIEIVSNLVSKGGFDFEIIPVDDGSSDETRSEIEKSLKLAFSEKIHPVFIAKNVGKGAALVEGFKVSKFSHILLLDGDLDISPETLWSFFKVMKEENKDIVIGSKMHPKSQIQYPVKRRIASRVYYGIVKLLFGLPVHDTQTGMKLFKREALSYSFDRMVTKRFAFDLEVLAIAHGAGFKVGEAPIVLDYKGREGALTVGNVRDVLIDTAAIFWRSKLLGYYKSLEPRPFPQKKPSVSVVIACPNISKMLEECISALLEQEELIEEIIVLPDFKEGIKEFRKVCVFPTGKVLPSEKRNSGIKKANGELIAFIDDDARPQKGWLENAIPYFSDEKVAAVGGPATTPPEDSFMRKMSGRVFASPLVSGGYRRRYVPTCVQSEEDLPSCNLIVRKNELEKIGGFDTAHWPGEDTILCLRIVHNSKKRIVYDPRVAVFHHRRPLFKAHLRQVSRYARHRGKFTKIFPQTSLKISYFIPSFLTVGTVGALILGVIWLSFSKAPLWLTCLVAIGNGILSIYLIIALIFAFSINLPTWGATFAGIVATHFVYGFSFLSGIFTSIMDDKPSGFDHQGSLK